MICRCVHTLLVVGLLSLVAACDSAPTSESPASVTLNAPDLFFPAAGEPAAPTTAVLAWKPVAHALDYEVSWTIGSVETTSITDHVTHVLADLVPGQDVRWRVRARRGSETGAWSPTRSFTALTAPKSVAPPRLSLPVNGQEDMEPWANLRWEPVPGALSYHVQVTIDEAMILYQADVEGLEVPALDLTGLIYTYPYWWKVRTLGPSGYSDWSPIWIFWIRDQA